MSVLQDNRLLIKGAPENIIQNSTKILTKSGQVLTLKQTQKDQILKSVSELAKKGLRTLAFSYKDQLGDLEGYDGKKTHKAHQLIQNQNNFEKLEQDQVFVGAVAL